MGLILSTPLDDGGKVIPGTAFLTHYFHSNILFDSLHSGPVYVV